MVNEDRAPRGFPQGFLFGAATAAYQIEGAVHEGGRGASIWDVYSHTPGRVANGDTGDVACDHFHRLDADLDLMADLGLTAYRFSIAWPRIVPEGRGRIEPAGLDFYSRLVDGLLERGIRPFATVYHWDLPQALDGGWTVRDTAHAFAEYTSVVGDALGDRVDTWITLNEPWCAAFLGYGSGEQAPGRTSNAEALTAAHHLNLAHGLGVQALRASAAGAAPIALTLNLHVFRGEGEGGAEAARILDAVGNRIFLGPVLDGCYPADLIEDTSRFTDWSFVLPGDLETIHQPIDAIGVNYYSTNRVALRESVDLAVEPEPSAFPGSDRVRFIDQGEPKTAMGWFVEPEGLTDLLTSLADRYPGVPLYVTENGAAYHDEVAPDGAVHDPARVAYLEQHLNAVVDAIDAGAPVRGYFVWSLLDNFEWSYGYEKRFGIVRVDYETLERTPKDSARWYADLIRRVAAEGDLAPREAASSGNPDGVRTP